MDPETYKLDDCIFEGAHSRVFRGTRSSDGLAVIVKQHRDLYPSPGALAVLEREYEITRTAAGPGVIEALDVFRDAHNVAIVLEDFGATSLAEHLTRERLPLGTVLEVAAQIARALAQVHGHGIVHKDVNPANIVWNPDTHVAKLIDFGLSQVLARETVSAGPTEGFAGTPAYASPEQTGRMNRTVDRRSDFYSFGVTLYEMVAGELPFNSDDHLGLVHAHLARTPDPPSQRDGTIPKIVSDLIMILLEKRAEHRYQSADGLVADIEECVAQLTANGHIDPFELRTTDFDETLWIPERLYGRQDEVAHLRRAFEQTAIGRGQVLLVAGFAGIGKTALVHEVLRELPGRAGHFVEGKFDQYSRSTPYSSLIDALGDLVRLVLSEDDESIEAFRSDVLAVVGTNGGVLTDLIPDLTHIIGSQPPPVDLPATEARNRFRIVMDGFVRCAASPEHPLVLFLDDLQWADLASVELVSVLASDPDLHNLLIVGAYRDNEVDDIHPLAIAIDQLKSTGVLVEHIVLGPLTDADVVSLVTDTVGNAPHRVGLAMACHTKTGGNAFFLRRFLEGLAHDGLLSFDRGARQWTWDLTAIETESATENVVDFLAKTIDRLSDESQRALRIAACIGDTFDLATLADTLGTSRSTTLQDLRSALTANLIRPTEEGFWFTAHVDEATTNFAYRFLHDRIQQAAHASLDQSEASQVHLSIGRRLLAEIAEPDEDPRLFDVVGHLAQAVDLIDDREEMDRLGVLLLAAGRRASRSAAFLEASDFYRQAHAALGNESWDRNYERTLAVHVEGARAAYLAGDQVTMHALIDVALERARTVLDRVVVQEVEISALVSGQRFEEAVRLALAVLAQLGVELPQAPTEQEVEAAIGSLVGLLTEWSAESILSLDPIDDPISEAAQRIANLTMSSAYLAAPALLPLLAAAVVTSSLKHGLSAASPYGFAIIGLVLSAGNVIDLGYETGKIALGMLDRVDDRMVRTRTQHVFHNLIKPWTDPLRELEDDQLQTFHTGIEAGDLEYATWALHSIPGNMVYAGVPLAGLADKTQQYLRIMEHHGQLPPFACTAPFGQLVDNLMGMTDDPAVLVGRGFDESALFEAHVETDFRGAAFIVTVVRTFARYLFGQFDEAVRLADLGGSYADGASATYHQVWWHQYRSLAILASAALGEGIDESTIEDSLRQIEVWNGFSPTNHLHRVLLLDAERSRVRGDVGDATDLYDRAIAAAWAGTFVNEAAIANERCGLFHLERGSATAARAYLLEAWHAFEAWGASAKVTHLLDQHRDLLRGSAPLGSARSTIGSSIRPPWPRTTSGTLTSSVDQLDLATLFKAASVISSETHLESLLNRVLDVAIENAGSTGGHLVVERNGELVIGAAHNAEGVDIGNIGASLGENEGVNQRIISYVWRTREPIVSSDVSSDTRWAKSSDFQDEGPRSVLCVPITHKDLTSGVVYLTNDLISGAFTEAHIHVLELLSTQAAISIQNTENTEELRAHRDHLEELVRDRTQELDQALAELREANDVLGRLSLTDALTGLANRRHFDQMFEDACRQSQRTGEPLSLLMIDVDLFKAYNDVHGHQAGDECLHAIAQVLSANLGGDGDAVARYGGEEFAAIIAGVNGADVTQIAERLLQAVRDLKLVHPGADDPGHVTISIGAAVLDEDHHTPAALISLADSRLYEAKRAGRNRLVG